MSRLSIPASRSLPRRLATPTRGGREAAWRRAKPVPPGRQQPGRTGRLARLNGALDKGALDAPTRERIALAGAEINGCDYCLSAHAYLGANLAKLSDAEIAVNRAVIRATRRPTRQLASPSSW